MGRLAWFLIAVVLALAGFDLLARGWLGWSGWLVAGIGLGIASGVVGSLLHDALAGGRERLP